MFLFSFSRFIGQENFQVIGSWKVETILLRFLRNLLTRYLHQPNYPWLKWCRKLLYRDPKSEGWSEECLKGQTKLFMFIQLILFYSVLTRKRVFKQNFFKICRIIQSILEKIFNKKAPSYWWYEGLESWKPTEVWRYKGNIQETYTTAKSWNWFM